MSHSSSLSPASRQTVDDFIQRSNFWLGVPGKDRSYFWQMNGPGRPYSHTAQDVAQFTKANCLAAALTHDSELLVEFKTKLYTDSEKNKISRFEGLPLAQLLGEYLVWIDHLFFFGIITHPTRRDGKLVANQPIIKLQFQKGLSVDGTNLHGIFAEDTATLYVDITESSGEFKSFEMGLCIIVHELLHVYLHLLTRDNSAANYFRDIVMGSGHGVQFQELLYFMFTRLSKWMPTIPQLEKLATDTRNDLRAAIAQPPVSEADARSLIASFRS
ncbi:hypothetical protein F4803DRAFT_556589 [Xylaria telfairii]|nr:hypothetical protein F4803DRAFT_556589 [Xylaria telfairii]